MPALFRLYGLSLGGLACMMLVPMILELAEQTNYWQPFAYSIFLTSFAALNLYLLNQDALKISKKYIFLFTTGIWLIIPAFATLPFMFTFGNYHLNFVDALFESISGLTTTGSTIMTGLDQAPHGLLLWRSLLEWMGGIGIVVVGIALLSELAGGGMQLFRTESSDKSDKILPKAKQVARATVIAYVTLTLCCTIAYYIAGMSGFDAINHAMTTISTGGFSTHDSSMTYFHDLAIEDIGSIFMLLGGIPMVVYVALLTGKKPNAILLSQTKAYLLFCSIVTIAFTVWLINHQVYEFWPAFTHAAFNVISIITTTGFASADYTQWGGFIIVAAYFLTIAGGCTGSTSGGIKIFRFQVMAATLKCSFRRLTHPHGIFTPSIAGKTINKSTESSVKIFFLKVRKFFPKFIVQFSGNKTYAFPFFLNVFHVLHLGVPIFKL